MDLNLIRSLVTVLAFIVFVAIVVRAWSAANRERYAEAAALPFADEAEPPSARHTGARRDPAPSKAVLRAEDPGARPDDGRTKKAIAGVNAASTGTTRNE
jgi:cytochrome c oxidase cbb3-type subunit IV